MFHGPSRSQFGIKPLYNAITPSVRTVCNMTINTKSFCHCSNHSNKLQQAAYVLITEIG